MIAYKTLEKLVKASHGMDELKRMEMRVHRHYENGTITAHQFQVLDVKIMERMAICMGEPMGLTGEGNAPELCLNAMPAWAQSLEVLP